jgi:lipoprotein-releasing system permease protein
MPYELFLALRYFRSRQRRRLARITSLVAVLGIAVGVAALMFALALANGFRDEMRDKILRGTAHLTVARSDGQPITNYRELAGQITTIPGVISATGTTYDGAVIVGPKGSAYAVLRGVDVENQQASSSSQRSEIERTIIAGSIDELSQTSTAAPKSPPVVLGSELAARSGLKVGDAASIITAHAGNSLANADKRSVRVVGIFRSGLFEYDSTWIYLPLDTAAAFAGETHAAAVISVQVGNIYNVKQIAVQVKELLGSGYTTIDWQEANRPLFTALAFERRVGVIIIGLIVFIAVLNITTSLILVVVERRRDIAVLNTLGATARSVMSIFIIEGAIVGALGAASGVVLGTVAILIANHYELISLAADVYSISNVPLRFNPGDTALAALVAFFLSVAATLYPAGAAARLRPVEILRDAS